MENPKIAWTQERVAKAAESAASFVELLSQEDFFRLGLIKWLRPSDLKKFRDWLAADDARKLKELSGRWFYKKDASNTRRMPLPDELHEHSDGIPLLCRIAEFEPDWIAEWCIWKIQKSKYEFVTDRACEEILSVTGDLAGHGIHKHSIQILDAVFEGRDDETASKYLDTLSAAWKGPVGSDPISQGIKHSHCRLDKVLRAPWNSCANPSGDKWKAWDDEFHWHAGKRNTLKGIACAPAPSFQLELGFSCGWRMAKNGIEPSASSLDAMFQELGIPNSPALAAEVSVLPMAKLWAILYMLSEYGGRYRSHSTEFVGLRQEVAQLVTVNPSLWGRSLQWILARSSVIGAVADAVTLESAAMYPDVSNALDIACNSESETIRLRARGLRTLLLGLDERDATLGHTLADAAARYMDGMPMFPHPLAPLSATWLGSSGVERLLSDGIKRACSRFAEEVRDQGGDIEEALTKSLVKEIETEFRSIKPKSAFVGNDDSRLPPSVLSVSQRPISKSTEEPRYGCDIAWLVSGVVPHRFESTWVDLVQVKKSLALQQGQGKTDRWKIDCQQLGTILRWSSTSTYWMIAKGGEVLVIPAKHLVALMHGTKVTAGAKSFTVQYSDVRMAAIPLEQYLVDLLIGQWLGSSSDEIVRFAQGEDASMRPRAAIEVAITIGQNG